MDLRSEVIKLEREKEARKQLTEPIELKIRIPKDLYKRLQQEAKMIDSSPEKIVFGLVTSRFRYFAGPTRRELPTNDSSDLLMTELLRQQSKKFDRL
jgi:hypothetical protein